MEVRGREGTNPGWVGQDMTVIFDGAEVEALVNLLIRHGEVYFMPDSDKSPADLHEYPDFGAHRLQAAAQKNVCDEIAYYTRRAVSTVTDMPCTLFTERRVGLWRRVLGACEAHSYSDGNIRRALQAQTSEQDRGEKEVNELDTIEMKSTDKSSGNEILVEIGVKSALSMMFTLLRQAWEQLAWQKQLTQTLLTSTALSLPQQFRAPTINLPNEVLRSALSILRGIPPLSFSNERSISGLGVHCLTQSTEFLLWILSPESLVDEEGKRLSAETTLSMALQYGTLSALLHWADRMLSCVASYQGKEEGEGGRANTVPNLSRDFSEHVLEEIRARTQVTFLMPSREGTPFKPKDLTPDGHVCLLEFSLFLCRELADLCYSCTQYFSQGLTGQQEERFLSEASEAYAFGSNSSSQLAMGTQEKILEATHMPHMANCQVVEAGQYCTFVIYGDGTVKACGKGSYGRLGLNNSDNQPTLKNITDFPQGTKIRRMATSRGSDGHSIAVNPQGNCYSWGDGNYGKLGHGDNLTQKAPRLIQGLAGKPARWVSCGNRHSAVTTMDGELFTWGEGDYGRLGHGTTGTLKVPTKVQNIEPIRQVDCGASHTVCLSMDSVKVWSFGAGDSGKLGHGDTNRQLLPKVIEALRGILSQKVCASSQFSLILSAAGKVYSCGNGSGVGKGTTEPRQYTPAIIEHLDQEIIIDIVTGDGHCLALTQRGQVFAWGTNSMGQCGQGHSTGSITLPTKVQGLEGKQIQQITAGTSHSIVWTAVPLDRRASSMWHWPYCVNVGEKTFKHLLTLLTKYGDVSTEQPSLPFTEKSVQEAFSLSILSLTRTHLSLAVPLGPQCVHMACGAQVRPLRNFLFKLMDSHLPPKLDHEASMALEIGQSVLLPPVLDRVDLLLAVLPENPAHIVSLTAGQCRQLEVLMSGFRDRDEMVGIMANEGMLFRRRDRKSWTTDTPHLPRLYKLMYRMVAYLEHTTVLYLTDEIPPHEYLTPFSSLLTTFEEFILCFFIHLMSLVSTTIDWCTVMDVNPEDVDQLHPHLTVFTTILEQHCMPLIAKVASLARESDQPYQYLVKHQDIFCNFILHQLPMHLALVSCNIHMIEYVTSIAAIFLRVAHTVHDIVSIIPPETIEAYEREELDWQPRNYKPEEVPLGKLRGEEGNTWKRVMDLERTLCFSAAKINQTVFMGNNMTRGKISEHDSLTYNTGKGRTKLLECGMVSNGGVCGHEEVKDAMNQWAALCKALPGTTDGLSLWTKCKADFEGVKVKPTSMPHVRVVNPVTWEDVKPVNIETTPTLFALALGCGKRDDAETLYQDMLEYARHKDWNTSFDEDTLPQLRQVSCAALACLLKHTGLCHYASTTPRAEAKKALHDVYRCVFMLRRDVFTNRPLPPTSSGQVDEQEMKQFTDTCTGICTTLFFFMVLLNPAIPEESERIVPHIPTSKDPPLSSSSTDDIGRRSPGAKTKFRTHQGSQGSPRLPSDSAIPKQIQESPMDIIHTSSTRTVSESESQDSMWSLSSVKVALSHLHWQREKVFRSDTPLHLKIGSTLMEVVGAGFHLKGDQLFHRPRMVIALLSQHKRGSHRVDGLERVIRFISEDSSLLLPSSRLIFLTECIPHHVHYSREIMAAPSVLQHRIKTLYHQVLQLILEETFHAEPEDLRNEGSVIGMQRKLLVALQWVNFPADADDLLLLFSLKVYPKLVALCGLVSSKVTDDVVLPDSELTHRTNLCGLMQLENVALRTGRCADVLKAHPHILSTVSDHLFGILEGFVNVSDPEVSERWKARGVSMEEREKKLGRFLCFLNSLSATHSSVREVLAEDRWFATLVQIVNINTTTGSPHVASLKTRLLTLQVLGTVMNELTDTSQEITDKCTKTIDAMMDLMQRCMFLAPLSNFHQSLKSDESSSTPVKQVVLPFRADAGHQHNCTVVVEGQGVVAQGSGVNSYVQGLLPLTSGTHTWKVSVESEAAVFCVGVAHKPLFREKDGTPSLWALEAHTGRLVHSGDTTEALFVVSEKDSIVVEFDARARTLAFAKNDEAFMKAFENVGREGEDLFPMVMFDRRTSSRVMLNPITHTSHSLLAHVKRREQDASGYPHMSPVGITLVHAIVNIIYQIQDKDPWNKAISHVVYSRLSDMDVLIHRLVDIKTALDSSAKDRTAGTDGLLPQLSSILNELQQEVWPVLTVLGGLDAGYCLGRDCQKYEEKETKVGTIVSVPDGERKVEVQEQITSTTSQVVRRSSRLKDLKLPVQSRFSLSLIYDKLTPSILMNLTHLAGYLDDQTSHLSTIIDQIHSKIHYSPTSPLHSLPYQQLCETQIQVAAAKSLQGILFNERVINLLDYRPPPSEAVVAAAGGVDKTVLAGAVREVLRCLVARAIKPSPLKVALRSMEMERVYSIVCYECLGAVAEYMSNSGHRRPQLTSQQIEATIPAPAPQHQVTRPDTLPPERLHFNYFEEDFLDAYFARNATPTYIHNMMDMGFTRAQINLALDRVEFPAHITDHGRMNMLVTWIVDHPQAAQEEEARARREQEEQSREEDRQKRLGEQRRKLEAEQAVAANQFLSLFGEMIDDEGEEKEATDGKDSKKSEVKRDTTHAPDLLEGPSVDHIIPDLGMQEMDGSREALQSLLSALGLSQTNPSPRLHSFSEPDPMGEVWCRRGQEYGEMFGSTSDGTLVSGGDEEVVDEHILKIGPQCEELISQAIKLQDVEENLSALQRLTSAVQTLVARRITMLIIASLSTNNAINFVEHLRSLGLVNIHSLVRLLRLVHAGRIDGTPGRHFGVRTPSSLLPIKGLECLSSALTTVVTSSLEAGSQLMQACSRDLLAAAVGGAKLLEKPRRRRRRNRNRAEEAIDPNEKSDLAVLATPNFAVTQSLVQTMAEAAGKALFANDTGVLLMTDALAACLFSSKLESQYRFWALEQLLKVFASSLRKEATAKLQLKDLILPSQVSQLKGHNGQAMACCDNTKGNKILSIGEDNALLVWSSEVNLDQPLVYPFPKQTQHGSGYLLPLLTQSSNQMCVAGALNDTLCIWRVKDGVTVTETFPELITTLQWKEGQRDSETPLLVVGLVGGDLVMVEVMGAHVNMSPSLQLTRLEHFGRGAISNLSWSSKGSKFACCSSTGTIQVYSGSSREYVPSIRITELAATAVSWSPDERLLTTLEPEGAVKLWDVSGELARVVSSLGPCTVLSWQPQAGNTGTMLLAGGCPDGSISLWLVDYLIRAELSKTVPGESGEGVEGERWGVKVTPVATLTGHTAPLTTLQFTDSSSSLLASGCRSGSVRIWDIQLCRLMKSVSQSVGEVLTLTWTASGLAVCYQNSNTVYLIPPGVSEYAGERCLLNCYPVLHSHGISDLSQAPCLSSLLKNLHHILLEQYTYEEREVRSSTQIVFSEYLQMLTALAVGLGLHTVLTSPPHPPHFTSPPPVQEWEWLRTFSQAIKMSDSLMKRSPLSEDIQVPHSNLTDPLTKEEEANRRDNGMWTLTMDTQILEWVTQHAEDWWTSQRSHVYVWGKGHWNVIGHSGRERILPTLLDQWKDVKMVTAGSYCTYVVRFDGSAASIGEGSYGRLGHTQTDNERILKNIESLQGIHVVEVVAGVRVTTATEEGFALALTNTGDVYSWGKSYRGRLGHPTADNQRTPKLVEALAGKDSKQIATCDYHTAVVTSNGQLYTCGAKENGKLGHGSLGPSGNIGRITRVTKFLDSDEQTDMNVRVGFVALGQSYTIVISEDMRQVFGCGKADHGVLGQRTISGDHHILFYLPHLTRYGPFKKAAAGYRNTILLNTRGQVILMGKFFDNTGVTEPEIVEFPGNEAVVDVQTGAGYILALTESGSVYTWGKNSSTSYELGYEMASNQTTPKRVDTLYGRKIRQISAGVRHCLALDTPPPIRGDVMFAVPLSIPARYPALRDTPCKAIHARLMLLNHFAKLMIASWKLFSIQNVRGEATRFNINPLLDANIRALVSQVYVEGMMAGIISRTMNNKTHGPSISVQRITIDESVSKTIFPQIATQILQKPVVDLRCSSRAWKVNLIGEGADDAGGVFDETMAQMCEEIEQGVVKILIPTPNGTNKIGFNTDRYVFDPSCTSPKDIRHLKFLGLLFGVAMRTKKPLNLHLARPMWKLLAGMTLTPDDLEEIDLMFIQTLYGIRDIHKSGIGEEDFSEMIPIESFETRSMNGKLVPIIPGGGITKLTFHNRKEYVEKSLKFRLHELDQQVAAVREGMSTMIPVPILTLMTAKKLEQYVCGMEEIDIMMLKKVVRYREGVDEKDQLIQWLWETLTSFTNEERTLFLRFVSGRSRLPARVSEIPQRFQIIKWGRAVDALPTSQTCFFQIRLPEYTSREILAEKLRYAIKHCRSIDMDNYMLRRGNDEYEEFESDDEW